MNKLVDILKSHRKEFHPVVPFDPRSYKLVLFDLTKNNKDLSRETTDNTGKFIDYVNARLKDAGAKFGIGGYDEDRELYGRSQVFDAKTGEEPRRLHLGIDIWGRPYTQVSSPLNGIVHSFGFNDRFGDYGATLILTHQLEGFVFHSLFGHLSLNSIRNCREGTNVSKGDIVGEFGIPAENGQWPPHLHFQVIIDMENQKGDYPGVCRLSEREKYLGNCPNPDLILQMMAYAF